MASSVIDSESVDRNKSNKNCLNLVCFTCKRAVKGELKCKNCDLRFHPSCAVRVKGLKVVNYEEVLCPPCAENAEGENHLKNLSKENELLNKLVLSLLDNQDLLRNKIMELESQVAKNNSSLTSPLGNFNSTTSESFLASKEVYDRSRSHEDRSGNQPVGNCSQTVKNGSQNSVNMSKKAFHANVKSNSQNNVDKVNQNENNLFSLKQVNSAILEAKTSAAVKELQIVENELHVDNTAWETQRSRRSRRRFLVGDNANAAEVKTVSKLVSLHVTRLHPDTSADSLKSVLISHFPEVLVEVLQSKYPKDYASMKVTISQDNYRHAWRKEIWPKGTFVSKFFIKKGLPQLAVDPRL